VATPTRNGPCPCGSGVKYKKCCLPKQTARLPPGGRIAEHNGQIMLVSRGVNAAHVDAAAAHFARRPRREGPAAQVMRFAEPLLTAAGNDDHRMQRALTLAMAFWNLALLHGKEHDEMLASLVDKIADGELHATEFRAIAADMVARHREMFPELHRGRA
jgi:SEC-C motif